MASEMLMDLRNFRVITEATLFSNHRLILAAAPEIATFTNDTTE